MSHEFDRRIRIAVICVLTQLPDRTKDRGAVIDQALADFTDCPCRDQAEQVVRRLVSVIPVCYGSQRSSAYWAKVKQFLTDEEAIALYLQRFPDALTASQRADIVRHLVNQRRFDPQLVAELVVERNFASRNGNNNGKLSSQPSRPYQWLW